MAKAFNKQLDDIVKRWDKQLRDSVSARQMKLLGNEAIRLIQERTRRGYGVEKDGGPQRRLKRLSSAYIKQRRRMRLSQFTTPGKSNLTRSGRMLAGLRLVKVQNGGFAIAGQIPRRYSERRGSALCYRARQAVFKPFSG